MVKPPPKGAPKRKAAPPVLKVSSPPPWPTDRQPSKRAKTVKNARAAASAPKVKPGQPPKESNVGINGKPKRRPDQVKKVKLRDQGYIPVPRGEFDVGRRRRPTVVGEGEDEDDEDEEGEESEDEVEGDDDDLMDLGDEEGLEAGFLLGMDKSALGR
jgi:nucleolar complex protein 3